MKLIRELNETFRYKTPQEELRQKGFDVYVKGRNIYVYSKDADKIEKWLASSPYKTYYKILVNKESVEKERKRKGDQVIKEDTMKPWQYTNGLNESDRDYIPGTFYPSDLSVDEKIRKIDKAGWGDAGFKLVYQWVKQNSISQNEFIKIIKYITRD